MDRHAVLGPHLVELVDAHDAAVSQHHRAPLEVKLPGSVADHRRGQTGGTRPFARGVDGDGRDLGRKLQKLRLGRRRVPQEQHVDVAAAPGAVGEPLARAAEEQARQGLLDVLVAKDVGGHTGKELAGRPGGAGEGAELELLLGREGRPRGGPRAVGVVDDAHDAEVGDLHGGRGPRAAAVFPAAAVAAAAARRERRVHADGGHARPGGDRAHEPAVDDGEQRPRQVPRGDVLGPLLELDGLLVDERGAALEDLERVDAAAARAVGAPRDRGASAGDGVAFGSIGRVILSFPRGNAGVFVVV